MHERIERCAFVTLLALGTALLPLASSAADEKTSEKEVVHAALVLHVGHRDEDYSVNGFDISPDGSLLAIACDDNQVRLWNIRRREWGRHWKASEEYLANVAFHPHGAQLATAGDDEDIFIWDVAMEGGGRQLKGATTYFALDLRYSPDGKTLFILDDDGFRAWDVKTGKERWQVTSNRAAIYSMAMSPDGKTLVLGGNDVIAFATSDGGSPRELHWIDTIARAMTYSPDGKTLLIAETTCRESKLVFGNPATGDVIQTINPDGRLHFSVVAFSPDGKLVAAGAEPGYLRIWDAESEELRCALSTKHRQIDRLQFTPDGRFIVTAGVESGGRLMVWNLSELLESERQTSVESTAKEQP